MASKRYGRRIYQYNLLLMYVGIMLVYISCKVLVS